MPAPPAALVNALRRGTVARHIFFEMTHSQGTVRMWDGLGDYRLDGNVYLGVGGGHSIEGISDSGEIQNHAIQCTLNRVPVDSIFETDPNIRGEECTIRIAWFNEDGTLLAPARIISKASGSHLVTKIDAEKSTVTAILRGPLAEWMTAPRANYSARDQRRRFAGDTGFDLTKTLENTSIAGWSKDEEASGGVPTILAPRSLHSALVDSITGAVVGDDSYGAFIRCAAVAFGSSLHTLIDLTGNYLEADTGAPARVDFVGSGIVNVGSGACYIDINGVVRSPGGKALIQGANPARFLRRQAAITSDGTPTATTVTSQNIGPAPGRQLALTGGAVNSSSSLGLVYCNKYGREVRHNSGTARRVSSGAAYVEETTGNVVTFTGGNVMQVSAANCVISTTGVVLTNAGNRVHLSGDPDAFLRVWT